MELHEGLEHFNVEVIPVKEKKSRKIKHRTARVPKSHHWCFSAVQVIVLEIREFTMDQSQTTAQDNHLTFCPSKLCSLESLLF